MKLGIQDPDHCDTAQRHGKGSWLASQLSVLEGHDTQETRGKLCANLGVVNLNLLQRRVHHITSVQQ